MRASKDILTIILLFSLVTTKAQSFEGLLTYSIKYEFNQDHKKLENQILQKLKDDGEYYDTIKIYIKQNRYLKLANQSKPHSTYYIPEKNQIVMLQKGEKTATVVDAKNHYLLNEVFDKPNISKIDSIEFINNIACDILHLSWEGLGDEWYFYNSDVAKLDPSLYSQHNYEYLNQILEMTGSYPLEIWKRLNQSISIKMSIVKIEPQPIANHIFELPELKPLKKKFAKELYETTGLQLMEIKN